ncbi:hypothetical protein CWM52_13625 [Raoultella sp. T31]|nr:hypothetical protein CWM52_13625 [Raoultella sp. T31]
MRRHNRPPTLSCLCACKEYRAILLAIFNLGCARPCHVLRVRSRVCAQSALKLAAPITPWPEEPRICH